MTDKDGVTLFEKKLGTQAEEEAVIELVTALDLIPLAIVQAAAYIKQRAPQCSVQQYLEQFRKGDRKRTKLLEKEGGRLRRD
ncbi:TPR-like protein [Penicillium cataractarum]|uniref:TPR-like protein n=1 Tax=Penicillium cataractarum TaxID=2100454 RepID=A0A9W9UUW5_9EURO|nr:TPR-like protein [Penicillium cataractarum]KAJ5358403.1 TPR-like protein [Penicillium cataractarum]